MLFLARGLVRCLSLALSALVSSLAAAALITLALSLQMGGETQNLRDDEFLLFAGIGIALAGWWFIWQTLLGPLALAFLVTELGRLQSIVWHLVFGGLVALAAAFQAGNTVSIDVLQTRPDLMQDWLVLLSSGFVGGFTHWLLAGHQAGKWMGEPKRP
ncbi:MAG: hypothetical protein AAFO73_07230 [Pseudomonadota bacterium]